MLVFGLLLSACGDGSSRQSEVSYSDSLNEQMQMETELTAKFLVLEDGLEALKILIWGSRGWSLYSGGEYLFAAFGNYLVRYNITENRVDSVVEFDKPEYWWCSTSVSSDGETVIAKAGNHPDYDVWTNQVLIDFRQKTCRLISDDFKLPEKENNPYFLYRVEKEFNTEENMFYKLYALDENLSDKEIKSVSTYAVSLSESVLIGQNHMGVIMGSSEEANGYLGYDKFVVIDITQDKIIQECIINKWDGYGCKY